MEFELTNESEKFVEFILFLGFIDNLESSLNYPLQFNVYVKFNGNALNVDDVIITIMDIAGTIGLDIPLKFPLDAIADYNNFASHPILIFFESINKIEHDTQRSNNNNNGIEQTWVSILDLLPMIYGTESTIGKMYGQYPLKAVKELNRDLLSNRVAHLNATVSISDKSSFYTWPPPLKNVLNITVHGLYNPPLKIAYKSLATTTCSAILNVAVEIDSNLHNAVFARGTYTNLTRDVNDLRWYSLDNMPATVSATGQRFEDYSGHVANSVNIPEPKDVLSKGPRFEWNLSQRFLLGETSSLSLQDFIFKQTYLPVTFVFYENPMVTNNKKLSKSNYASNNTNVDDNVIFVALLDLSMLLQQNCTSVRCLSKVYTLDADIIKTNGFSLTNLNISEFMETDNNIKHSHLGQSDISLLVTSSSKTTQMISKWALPFAVIDVSVIHSFYDQYLKYITARLSDLNIIPQKPMAITCVSSASYKYQESLKNIIEMLIRKSKTIMSDQSGVFDMTELKVSGALQSMQSTLCDKIQMYITETYGGPVIGETIQSFLNRIFTDLVNLMKKTVKSFEFPHSSAAENVKCTRTIVYAREADELKQTERAKTFYFDLISTAGPRCNPNYWLLYASFCSRQLDFDTALEYVKEVLLVDSGNRIGLFLYAAIQLTIHEDNNNGEIVLKSLVMSHEDFNEAYALLSVHYSIMKMHKASYIMLQRAYLSMKEDEIENNYYFLHQNLLSWQPIGYNNDPLIKCAVLLLKLELVKLATYCLNLVKNQCEQYHYYMAVCQYKLENYLESLECLNNEELIGKFKKVTDMLKFLNNIELSKPLEMLENDVLDVLYAEIPQKELHLVYLKGALYYYKNKWYTKAMEICQIACTVLRTPMIFTLLAKCWIQIGEMESAECALNEANVMDIKNEEVWAYLSAVNLKMGNTEESKICYTRALECGLKPAMQKEITISFGLKIDTLI